MGDNDIEGRRAVRAGWCRSWQTGGCWIISYLSSGCGCTIDSSGQSRVINRLQRNGNWALRRESSALTSESCFCFPPQQQLVSPCPGMCPAASQVTPVLHTLQGQLVGLCCPGICPWCSVPCTVSARRQDPVGCARYCGKNPVSWAAE